MRTLSFILVACALLAVGCSPASIARPFEPSPLPPDKPGPGPQPTTVLFPSTGPERTADPVSVGKMLLETKGDVHWLEPPTPMLAENMTYLQAKEVVPMLSRGADQVLPDATSLWIVIFNGRWQLPPYGQDQGSLAPTIYEGCSMVLFTDAGDELIAIGDTACPGKR